MTNKPDKPKQNDFNYVLSQQIKRGLRDKEYYLNKAIDDAVRKDKF